MEYSDVWVIGSFVILGRFIDWLRFFEFAGGYLICIANVIMELGKSGGIYLLSMNENTVIAYAGLFVYLLTNVLSKCMTRKTIFFVCFGDLFQKNVN